jgi:glutamyl-tRNA reductase
MQPPTPRDGSMTAASSRSTTAHAVSVSVVGLSYKTAPLDVRERLAFDPPELPAILASLQRIPAIRECVLLSTCNRTETYVAASGEVAVTDVLHALGEQRNLPPSALEPVVYVHRADAARHLMRVAAGLDSMVLGEAQILGQVRRTFEIAREARATGPILNHVFQLALATGRRIRRDTGLALLPISVPRAALTLSDRVLGSVSGRKVVVVGAGKIARLAVDAFRAAGATIVAIANRTPAAAEALAARVGASGVTLDALGGLTRDAHILVVCVGAEAPTVGVEALNHPQRRAPILVIDLGIPRGVAPNVASLAGVSLYTLDDLPAAGVIGGIPQEDLRLADRLIDHAVARLDRWLAARAAAPVIEALRGRADSIVSDALQRANGRLSGLTDSQRDAVRIAIASAMHKMLHHPTVRLRELASHHDAVGLEIARALFALDTEPTARGGSGTE